MKVYVVFDFPEIVDPSGQDADWIIDSLSHDLKKMANEGEYDWYINDAIEE